MGIHRILVHESCIMTGVVLPTDKVAALSDLCRQFASGQRFPLGVTERLTAAILEREQESSTAIGRRLAIPHATIAGIERGCVGWFALKQPLDFDSLDGDPVRLVLLFVGSLNDAPELWSRAMAAVSRMLKEQARFDALLKSATPEEFRSLLHAYLL